MHFMEKEIKLNKNSLKTYITSKLTLVNYISTQKKIQNFQKFVKNLGCYLKNEGKKFMNFMEKRNHQQNPYEYASWWHIRSSRGWLSSLLY